MDSYKEKITILYVEDEKDILEGYAKALSRVSDTLYTAQNGLEGLELFKKHLPNIVITDIKMPIMDGLEMAKEIKKIDADVNIVFTTAHSESAYLLEAIELHAEGYLLKPVQKKSLQSLVQKLSKRIMLEKENKEQRDILQHIIDSENSMTVITNTTNVSFASTSFLNFFCVSGMDEFQSKIHTFLDIFSDENQIINKNNILASSQNNIDFYKFIQKIDETSRIVKLKNCKNNIKSFFINISKINDINYLINFTDITKLSQEKEATEKKVYKDSLTGVSNREKFEEVFEYELTQSKRYNRELSLAVLDIDYFKNFNDKFGHLVGDEILTMLSQNIEKNKRESDFFARWGGEEFVILFTSTNLEIATNLTENFRKIIQNMKHKSAGEVTASFGLSSYKEGDTKESIFKRADDALYEAKHSGRNCLRSIV
ncbi:diguanylate cyclase [Sulfurimonas sp.]|uniref:GGDEF domain-containing response regulator n=1 Tax=Sulfurimonas sp. TaxID=2022749 RepID=UPI002AB061CC|nr:diguanylate cyclase [Sulfurimonas sp.]